VRQPKALTINNKLIFPSVALLFIMQKIQELHVILKKIVSKKMINK